MEWSLIDHSPDSETIILKGLNLTALYYPERLCFMKKIDLSDNDLKNCGSLSALLLCQDLNLTNNCLRSSVDLSREVIGLKHLQTLELKGNPCQYDFKSDQFPGVQIR